jgi:hypothetical protein
MQTKRLPQTQSELEEWIQRSGGAYETFLSGASAGHRVQIGERTFSMNFTSLRTFTERAYPGPQFGTSKEIYEFASLALEHFAFDEIVSQRAVERFYTEYSQYHDPDVLRVFADFLEESGSDRAAVLRSMIEALPGAETVPRPEEPAPQRKTRRKRR